MSVHAKRGHASCVVKWARWGWQRANRNDVARRGRLIRPELPQEPEKFNRRADLPRFDRAPKLGADRCFDLQAQEPKEFELRRRILSLHATIGSRLTLEVA